MGHRHLYTTDRPDIYTDGKRTVIVLDGERRPNDLLSQQPLARGETLRFSINRNGGFCFAKKKVVTPQFEAQPKLDGDGEQIPNPEHARQQRDWGGSHEPEFEMENVLLEEPNVRLHYEIDRDWWSRNAYTGLRFGDRK